jgi:hypothetical protein
MKKCSYCGAEYPDEANICAVDHTPLTGKPLETDGEKAACDDGKHEPVFETVELESDVPPDAEAALCVSCLFPQPPGFPLVQTMRRSNEFHCWDFNARRGSNGQFRFSPGSGETCQLRGRVWHLDLLFARASS